MVDIAKTCETCSQDHIWNDAENPSAGGICCYKGITRPIFSSTCCRFYLTDYDLLSILRLRLGELESQQAATTVTEKEPISTT
jgi:hypothetical protein